jgi:LysR family transcriptional regulator, low CO2-responsive transcriptional regulator
MTPGQARAFLAVALKGSFSEAARSIGVSQPTVTTQIKEIEREHEVELFCRGARGATLTPAGQALVPFIQRMFSNFDEAGAYLDTLKGMHRGQLRIGSYGPYDVIKLVAQYCARFPGVSVSVDFANSQILAEKLISYELDVAVMGRIKAESKFHSLPFRNPPLVAIAPRLAPWIGRSSVKVSDFSGQTIVCREPGSAARAAHDQLLARSRVSAGRIIQFASREGVVNAVAEGIGIGTIFDEGILPGDRVVKLKITGADVHSKVEIVCLADRRKNMLISSFLSIAEQVRSAPRERTTNS